MPQRLRNAVRGAIIIILFYEAYNFYRFVEHFREGGEFVPRPPAVEAFLPISSLVALKSWVANGIYDPIHPAGLAILVGAILTALFFMRGFCGWLCPVGALSEALGSLGLKLTSRKLVPPRAIDLSLRTIKYLLLAFFVKLILIDMSGEAARAFIHTPYNKVVEVKMLDFWLEPARATILATGFLVGASLLVQNFWCRYLCPYGALLGVVGLLTPLRVRRMASKCTNCGLCTRACPNYIHVEEKEAVGSQECTRCLKCLKACPSGALFVGSKSREIPARAFGLGLVALFLAVLALAKFTGHWDSAVTYREYAELVPRAHLFTH